MKTVLNFKKAAASGCFFLPLLLASAALAPATQSAPLQPEAPTAIVRGYKAVEAETGQQWMAVTANRYATETAALVLKQGGHAVDAAIAAQMMLNLVEPQSSGLGGGGFMMVWDQKSQVLKAYDGRETAPSATLADDFLDAEGNPQAFYDIVRRGKAVGVPGLLAMLELAHKQHGKLAWKSLMLPAAEKAENGFFVSQRLHALLQNDALLKEDPHAAALYYPAENTVEAGYFLRNPALANTLKTIANTGANGFYKGTFPQQIIKAISVKTGEKSSLRPSDFSQYKAVERAPICAVVMDHKVCGMPPPSAGGIAVLQMLQLLDMQLAGKKTNMTQTDTAGLVRWKPEQLSAWLKASRLAYEDRARFVGDPDMVEINTQKLISRPYLKQRLTEFSLAQGLNSEERPSTTHLSIVDAQGNAVALTSSIEDQFGSRIMVNGFLLNNQLTDFDLKPSDSKVKTPNQVEAGKRPRSSMAPTIVLSNTEPMRVVSIIGSPGGAQIPAFIASRLMAHWWGNTQPSAAVSVGHVVLRENRLDLERGAHAADFAQNLKKILPAGEATDNLNVNVTPQTSGVNWIQRTPEGWLGVADPRREGSVLSDRSAQ